MTTPAEGERAGAGGYALLAFLTLLNVMNFVDRQLLASFANFIKPDLNLTNTEFGLLTGLVFIMFYAAAGLFMGALADTVHRPRLIAGALMLWSLLTAASGMARNFVQLALPRIFIGVGESALTPTSMSMLADRFPARQLGFASGAYYMGVPIGVGVSLLIAGYLGPAIGWRMCFYLLGGIGAVLALIMLFVPDKRKTHAPDGARPSLIAIIRQGAAITAQTPALFLTMTGAVVMHFILGAAAFDQLWYVAERGFERGEIARMTGLIACVFGVAGNLFGGLVGDAWLKRTGQSRAVFLCWLMIALAPINLAYRLAPPDSVWFWAGIACGYFQLGAFYGPAFATVQELAPPQVRATLVAFLILVSNVVGLGVGITGSGIMVDALIARDIANPYTWTLFSFTCLSMLAIPCFFFAGRLRPAPAPAAA
ncbi:MAG: MFS transporter [Alphaproteobacteria bacterium]|nr:MFS transporter [Alphaproteobacteria bacterium]